MSSSRGNSNWLLALATIPFVLSIGMHAWGVVPQSAPTPAERNSLIFDYYAYNRVLTLQEQPAGHYVFRNRSHKPVIIKSMTPSCDCVILSLYDVAQGRKSMEQLTADDQLPSENVTIEPGMMCVLFAQMDTSTKEAGYHEFDIKLYTQDPTEQSAETQEINLKFSLTLPQPKLALHPKTAIFSQTSARVQTRTIKLTDHRGNDFNVTNLKSDSEYLTVELGEATYDAATGKTQEIILSTVEEVPTGRHQFFVSFNTDDPEYKTMKIAVMIDSIGGKLQRLTQSSDHFYFAIPEAETNPVVRTMTLTDRSREGLKIKSTKTSSEFLTAQITETREIKEFVTEFTLEVTLKPEFSPGEHRELVTLETDHSRWPEISIPVKINCFNEKDTTSTDLPETPAESNSKPTP